MEPREFANLSQAELSLRMGTDASLIGGAWKKGRKGKVREPHPDMYLRLKYPILFYIELFVNL